MHVFKKTALCFWLALVGCGGDNNDGSESPSSNNITKPTTPLPTTPLPIIPLTAITATVNTTSPSVNLKNVININLTDSDAANSPSITISETKTPKIDSIIAAEANMYEVQNTADSEITIKISKPLSSDVDVVINVPAKLSTTLKETEGVLPYFFEMDINDGDGITPLSAKYIVANKTLLAKIPVKAFAKQDDGTWKAIIKLAVVTTYPSQEVESIVASHFKSVKSLPAIGGRKPVVKCPLPEECIETSGFHMRGGGTHDGIDLRAKVDTNVVVPIEDSFSVINALRYDQNDNSAGTHVSLKQKFFWLPVGLKFFHLKSMQVRINDSVNYGDLIGSSGQSGFGRPDGHREAHLHMELLKPSMMFESCGENLESSECKISFAVAKVDPFPHMLQRVEIEKTDGNGNVDNSDIELNKPFILQLEGYDGKKEESNVKKVRSEISREPSTRDRRVKWEIFDANDRLVVSYFYDYENKEYEFKEYELESSKSIKMENVSEASKDFDKKKLTVLKEGSYTVKAYWDGTELKAEYDIYAKVCTDKLQSDLEKAVVGDWTVTLIESNSSYRLKVLSEGISGHSDRNIMYYQADGTPFPDWALHAYNYQVPGGYTYLAKWNISDCKFYESGFWHPAFDDLEREPLTLPVKGFNVFSSYDETNPKGIAQKYLKN